MLSLSRVLTLLVAAFAVAAVVAVPSRTTTDDDPHVNPVGIITRSLRPKSAVYLTNAQRLARGLPLNNPFYGRRRAKASPSPSPKPKPKPRPSPSRRPSPRPSYRPSSTTSHKSTSVTSHKSSSTTSHKSSSTTSSHKSSSTTKHKSSTTPSRKPSPRPSRKPSTRPSPRPSPRPSHHPSPRPRNTPSSRPSPKPSPRPSHKPSPRPSSSPACVAKTGYIEAKVEGQATGYVSMNTNVYGEYEFTTDASEALSVSLSYCADKKDTFDIMTLNGAADFDYLGFITGSSNHGTKRDLDQGSYNYAYLGGVHKERRGPAVRADNTFTCATGLKESVESNVWSVNGDKYLSVSWVNTDKSTPCVTVLYFSDDNNFVITADPEKYMKTFGGGEITTFKFVTA
ncbi:hypothetical protein L227DRAFT_377323 [Lentinus tigrinus ALCF2SS1-6]|uniref:Uncharacterized protein n=1 Tax=Lentinus tigrinus ALCF2SS1-6 TaxID=1328759 RepID=A0A5C2RUH8_9APHY|nr:hypothetical protein L227DRAFT_377323 [Lentinus tigrinus ALCF2SS1-6]